MADMAPLLGRVQLAADPLGAAVAGSLAARSPFAGSVSRVTYTPTAAVTGAATNNRTLQVVNHGQAGAGTTVVATLTFDAGVNAAAFDELALTLQAAADLVVADGDILEFRSSPNGTGLADPGGLVTVEVNR